MEPLLISIIVPVFRVEQYIRECIDSIIAQTYRNWELILVDDGSPDRSGQICDEYAEKDNRIKVIHQENGGVSSARNIGIELAQGEYITFIDADDYVDSNYLEEFAPKGDDLYIENFIRFGEINKTEVCTDNIDRSNVTEIRTYWAELLKKTLFLAPWCKLFKKDVILANSIRFPLGMKNAEDIHFCLEYIMYVQSLVTIPQAHYHQRYSPSEANLKYCVSTEEYEFHIKKILKQVSKAEKKLGISLTELRKSFKFRFWMFYITWLNKQEHLRQLQEILIYTYKGLFRYCKFRDALSLYYRTLFPAVYNSLHKDS